MIFQTVLGDQVTVLGHSSSDCGWYQRVFVQDTKNCNRYWIAQDLVQPRGSKGEMVKTFPTQMDADIYAESHAHVYVSTQRLGSQYVVVTAR